jgi:ribosomal protein S6E (S10)
MDPNQSPLGGLITYNNIMPKNKKKTKKSRTSKETQELARGIGRAVGMAIGSQVGHPVAGSALGGTLAAKLSRVVGRGDYEINPTPAKNSIVGKASNHPSFGPRADKVRITKREFVRNVIVGDEAWEVNTLVVQPGMYNSFPGLANTARNYKKYKFNGLMYEFVSNTSGYAANPAMGTIILAYVPNADDPPFTNKIAMENTANSISARPDKNIVFGVECDPSLTPYNQYFVRTSDTTLTDNTIEDFGAVSIGLSGIIPSAGGYIEGSVLGELWVTYDIEFDVPALPTLGVGFLSLTASDVTGSRIFGTTSVARMAGGQCSAFTADWKYISLYGALPGQVYAIYIRWDPGSAGQDNFLIVPDMATSTNLKYVDMFSDEGLLQSTVYNPAVSAIGSPRTLVTAVEVVPGGSTPVLKFTVQGGAVASDNDDHCNVLIWAMGQGQVFAL